MNNPVGLIVFKGRFKHTIASDLMNDLSFVVCKMLMAIPENDAKPLVEHGQVAGFLNQSYKAIGLERIETLSVIHSVIKLQSKGPVMSISAKSTI